MSGIKLFDTFQQDPTYGRYDKRRLGLYLHIPFCRSKCPYCDFCSFPHPAEDTMAVYADELCRRIRAAGEKIAEDGRIEGVDTVYFGGGTPTLLPIDSVRQITRAVQESFAVLPDAEVTVEGNPAAASVEALAAWRAGGVNRLSLGVQSVHDTELHALGRLHRWGDVERTVADARAEGIDNINLDFMLGIPYQTSDTLAETLERAVSLVPQHLSAYTLMLEEGTPYHRRGRAALGLPADEDTADEQAVALWEQASRTLTAAGYEHYEISNYARPGYRSRHNLHTWQCRDYLGLGVAAHSCMDGVRFGQSRDMEGFLAGKDITEFTEVLPPADRESEFIMLALRLSDGIEEEEFSRRFGHDFWHTYGEICIPYIEMGLMGRKDGRVFLTEAGFPVSNAILADLI